MSWRYLFKEIELICETLCRYLITLLVRFDCSQNIPDEYNSPNKVTFPNSQKTNAEGILVDASIFFLLPCSYKQHLKELQYQSTQPYCYRMTLKITTKKFYLKTPKIYIKRQYFEQRVSYLPNIGVVCWWKGRLIAK